MRTISFRDLQTQIQDHYHNQRYRAAFDLAGRYLQTYPDQAALLYYWQVCLLASLGEIENAVQLLEQTITQGIWYAEFLLRQSPALQSLQEHPTFEQLVQMSQRYQALDETNRYPLLTVRPEGCCLPNDQPCSMLLALHENASNARLCLDYWRTVANAGWLVAAPQSTQGMWKGGYVWNDWDAARQEIIRDYQSALEYYSIDPERVVLAGVTTGGELAMRLALSGDLPARGFLAISPEGSLFEEHDNLQSYLADMADRDLVGVILIGEREGSERRTILRKVTELILEAGGECRLEVLPGTRNAADSASDDQILAILENIVEYSA